MTRVWEGRIASEVGDSFQDHGNVIVKVTCQAIAADTLGEKGLLRMLNGS